MAVEHRRSVSIIAYELTIMPTLVCTSSDSGLSHSLATCLKAPKNRKLSSSVGTRELKISPPGEYFPAAFRNDAGRRLRKPLRSVPYKLVFLSFSSSKHTCSIENYLLLYAPKPKGEKNLMHTGVWFSCAVCVHVLYQNINIKLNFRFWFWFVDLKEGSQWICHWLIKDLLRLLFCSYRDGALLSPT